MPTELTDDGIDEMMLVNVKSALYGMPKSLAHFRLMPTRALQRADAWACFIPRSARIPSCCRRP